MQSSGAVIKGNYRYLLWKKWNSNLKTISFIMLNPSRADAEVNDPTITRCISFALSWGAIRVEEGISTSPLSSETVRVSFPTHGYSNVSILSLLTPC